MGLPACGTERAPTAPVIPGPPPAHGPLRVTAFRLDVNVAKGTATVTAPPAVLRARGPHDDVGPSYSILAGDVVQLSTGNYAASAVGQYIPGKVRVSFDLRVTNRLAGLELITPTFPVPPPSAAGILVFPFETVVTVSQGGTSTGGDGTEVIVEVPNAGQVVTSPDWDGAPFNYFNDAGCGAGADDCYPWEQFAEPLGPLATSEVQRVGFDIDPTVGSFRARIIVAADVRASAPAPVGSVAGTVTSPQRGALTGTVVAVAPDGATATANGGGTYVVSGLTPGAKQVTLGSLPPGCIDPGPLAATVTSGSQSTLDIVVQCPGATGSVTGAVLSSLGGPLGGVVVTVSGQTGFPVHDTTDAAGAFTVTGVPVGPSAMGSLVLTGLPTACTDPGTIPVAGLVAGGTTTVVVTVACVSGGAQGYALDATWGAVAGGQVTLTLAIHMGTYNDPAINGAGPDDLFAIQGAVGYDPSRLQFAGCTNVAGSGLANGAFNGSVPGTVQLGNFTTAAPQTGLLGIASCTFTVSSGAPATVVTATSVSVAESVGGQDLVPRIVVTEGTLVLP